MDSEDTINLVYVAGEAIDGRCATAEEFSCNEKGAVLHDGYVDIAHFDRAGKVVTMAAYGHGEDEVEANEFLGECEFAIKRVLVLHGHQDKGWTMRDIGDDFEEYDRICGKEDG